MNMSQQIKQIKKPSNIKCFKFIIGCSICCSIFFLLFAITVPILIAKLLKSQAQDGIVMTKSTQGLWAHIPGQTNTFTKRNFTFFNFTNSKQVLYFGKKPIFKQISGYAIEQVQDFEDIQYVQNNQIVKFNFWLHFNQIPTSRNINQKVKVLNLGPLGFWNTLKNSDYPVFSIQGLGQLFFSLRDTFKSTAIGQAISQQFLSNFTNLLGLGQSCSININTIQFLWNDPNYGLSDPNNYQAWVDAIDNGISSDQAYFLKDYFALSQLQLSCLLDTMVDWSKSLNKILQNWYCKGNDIICSSEQFTYRQLSGSIITNNPPPGTQPTLSICDQNITCQGSPQISAYLQNIFIEDFPDKKELLSLTYDNQQMKNWFNPSKQQFCILHIGNLNYLWEQGRLFDDTNIQTYLENIQKRFKLLTLNHTFVWWNWIKYVTKQFVLKQKQNGTNGIAGIGGIASQAIYQSFSAAADWLKIQLISAKLSFKLVNLNKTCKNLIQDSVSNISTQAIESICSTIDFKKRQTLQQIIYLCQNDHSQKWNQFSQTYNISYYSIIQICDQNINSFADLIKQSQIQLDDYYKCEMTPNKKCSTFQLGIKQWASSFITLNPIPQIFQKPSYTINQWNSDIPAYQYRYFLRYIDRDDQKTLQKTPNQTLLIDFLSFDKIFSGPMIQKLFVLEDQKQFQKLFYFKQSDLIKSYIRYSVIQIGFGGFVQQRSVKQLLFGYQDQFLKNIRDMDPAMGGDPSINIVVSINQPNSTKQQSKLYPQSMFSGVNNNRNTRFYQTINGKNYINFNYSFFNGNQIVNDVKNPWIQQDGFIGTDAFQNPPGLKPDNSNNISVFITTLYRHGSLARTKSVHKHGLQLYQCRILPQMFQSQYQNPKNRIYYQQYQGFLNLTGINGAPIFISQNHFYRTPSNWSSFIDIYNQQGTFIYNSSIYDDTYILVQPNSGTTLSASIYLQTNILWGNDDLFQNGKTMMLPLFSLFRSGNISDSAAQKLFGPLKVALIIKNKSLYIGIVLSGLSIMIGCGVYLTNIRKKKQLLDRNQNQLLYSMQKVNNNVEQQ